MRQDPRTVPWPRWQEMLSRQWFNAGQLPERWPNINPLLQWHKQIKATCFSSFWPTGPGRSLAQPRLTGIRLVNNTTYRTLTEPRWRHPQRRSIAIDWLFSLARIAVFKGESSQMTGPSVIKSPPLFKQDTALNNLTVFTCPIGFYRLISENETDNVICRKHSKQDTLTQC